MKFTKTDVAYLVSILAFTIIFLVQIFIFSDLEFDSKIYYFSGFLSIFNGVFMLKRAKVNEVLKAPKIYYILSYLIIVIGVLFSIAACIHSPFVDLKEKIFYVFMGISIIFFYNSKKYTKNC